MDRFDSLRAGVLQDMECEPLPQASGRRESPARRRKREKVERTVDSFLQAMAGPNPPKTEEEMLCQLTPVAAWILSWLVRQLLTQILKACWRRWTESSQTQGLPRC